MHIPIQTSILNALLFGSKTITVLLGSVGIFFGIGFAVGDTSSDDYYPFVVLFNQYIWSGIFIVYGMLKFYQVCLPCSSRLKIANSIAGMWLWSYTAISFIFYDSRAVTPGEFLLLLPLLYEITELTIDLFQHRNFRKKGITNDSNLPNIYS